jgi:phytanoyl-CoA hydroxylase
VTFWFALDASTTENGCLFVVPGSHRYGAVPHAGAEARVSDDRWCSGGPIAVPLPPGSAIAFHPYLLHSSGPNRSSRPRRALTLRYVAVETP